jgi:cytochrome c oxidase assembly factor CtaG
MRGWLALRHTRPATVHVWRLASFLAGLLALFVAVSSPLDTFSEIDALRDQIAAGAFMWVFGSLVFLVPTIFLIVRILMSATPVDSKTGLEKACAPAQ